jgi:hypothetical protein
MLRRRAGADVCLEMAFSKITAEPTERKSRAKVRVVTRGICPGFETR